MKVLSKEWRNLDRRAKNKYFKFWRKKDKRERRAPCFVCLDCLTGFNAFQKCRIKECFCSKCGKKMYRGRGWFCSLRPELRECDYCGLCDTGTDADFRDELYDSINGNLGNIKAGKL
jgi:hypothetical protein